MFVSYVELHAHSAFSFLDGASLPDELAAAAVELGHDALALTDHDNVCGAMEFARSAQAVGLRPIHGAELTLDDGRHLTLLVESDQGWRNLCRLITRAHAHTRGAVAEEAVADLARAEGSARGGRARGPGAGTLALGARHDAEGPVAEGDATGFVRGGSRPVAREDPLVAAALPGARMGTRALRGRIRQATQPFVTLEAVAEHAEGLVCLSGCATHGVDDLPSLRRLRAAFGRDNLYVELQRPYLRDDRARNRRRVQLARELELRCVATGNVHAHARSRGPLQDALVAVRLHTTLDASEPGRRGNFSHVLASPAAMAARFAADHPEAVAETERLADRLRFDLTQGLGYRYPGAEDETADQTLAELCGDRLADRYATVSAAHRAEARRRLDEELRIIGKLGLAGFFLLHRDMLELAREVAVEVRGPDSVRALLPPGRGRGSSVSSIVCYLTGLSHVDPVANDLFIGRFLNDELSALPDIDLDFPRDIRAALIPRIHTVFGADRSALVAAFPTYRARGAIRELGKALGLPPGEIERVARGSEGWSAQDVARDVATALGERRVGSGRWAWLTRLADEAHGLPRHLSQHSGGMVVATRPLHDCCPIVPAAMEGRQMVQWDKDSCADAGFLKIDLLGLGMLSAVERAVEAIAATRGERIDLSRIPYDDPPTYEAIQNAETTGVFQIESRAQMASLRRTRPSNLQELTIQVAIVRPGPIQGGAVNPYIERRQRLRLDPGFEVPYDHPSLVEPLKETLGTIIFQDQVIEVAMAFAGFTAGEAEGLRRAMSRKRSEAAIEAHHRRFVEGAMRTHDDVTPELAERVFQMVRGFSGFGFPKAHGAAFGLLAYQSTWLRVHYPAQFLCALLNEQPMGFYPPDSLVHEAQRRGIEVLAPEINASAVECTAHAVAAGRPPRPPGKTAPPGRDRRAARAGAARARLRARRAAARRRGARRRARGRRAVPRRRRPRRPRRRRAAGAGGARLGGRLRRARRRRPPRRAVAARRRGAGAAGARRDAAGAAAGAAGRARAARAERVGRHARRLRHDRPDGEGASAAAAAAAARARRRHQQTAGGAAARRAREARRDGRRAAAAGHRAAAIVFLLIEDEYGTVNLVVRPELYDSHRLTVRTEPLVLVEGKLERLPAAGGGISVLLDRIGPLDIGDGRLGTVIAKRLLAGSTSPPRRAMEQQHAGRGSRRSRAPSRVRRPAPSAPSPPR